MRKTTQSAAFWQGSQRVIVVDHVKKHRPSDLFAKIGVGQHFFESESWKDDEWSSKSLAGAISNMARTPSHFSLKLLHFPQFGRLEIEGVSDFYVSFSLRLFVILKCGHAQSHESSRRASAWKNCGVGYRDGLTYGAGVSGKRAPSGEIRGNLDEVI